MKNPELINKLRRILALAESGVDGEKTAAQAKLAYLLAEHNLTLDDLTDGGPKMRFSFQATGAQERQILAQVICIAMGSDSVKWRVGRKAVSVEMTTPQYAEIVVRWETLRKAWRKEWAKIRKAAPDAFIASNRLYSPQGDGSESSTLSTEEVARIRGMMASMEPVEIHRRIGAGKDF